MDPPPPVQPSQSAAQPTAASFPKLAILDPSLPHTFQRPAKLINDGPDVPRFLTSKAYRDIGTFVLQLNHALCPRRPPPPSTAPAQAFTLDGPRQDPPSVTQLAELLARAEALVDEAPPDPGPRRFGNISFRRWHELLAERGPALLRECVSEDVLHFGGGAAQGEEEGGGDKVGSVDELTAYFLGAFGSAQRLDYGTGHELSFLAFLGCLWKLGAFKDGGDVDGEIERSIVFGVIERYLKVVRRLILTYTLEPAGSHGVWGLDDHSFVPYIFGSAQLSRPIHPADPMPLEGSLPGAPKPSAITNSTEVDLLRSSNMYFSAVGFINDVKKGPFWEHSPILFDVSGIRDGWGKINKGMLKMFHAEVLAKFPVVQHFPLGSLFAWDVDPDAPPPVQSVHVASQPAAAAVSGPGTAAPWATQAPRVPGGGAAGGVGGGGGGPSGVPQARSPWAGRSAMPRVSRMGQPDTGPPPPTEFPKGKAGTTSAQYTVTRAPWAKD